MPQKHTIKDGDSITSIAETYGLFEETLWMHADNASLRDMRPNKNILAPGDIVVIPDKEIHQETCAAETKHKFRRKGVPAKFRVQLFEMGVPRDEQSYRFDIDGTIHEGKTDGNGVLEETVSPSASKGVLIIGPDEEKMEFLFGTLHPADTSKGFAQRLANLGLYHGDLDVAADNAILITTIKSFQAKYELTVNGEMDDATTDKLIEVHDVK
jgi:N-acetylmuramoyl-L-alanine amidase